MRFNELENRGFESLELSTQIVIFEAQKRGYRVEVLDWKNNFIRISGNERIEYIMQATRTRADNYISPLIMENKLVTKKILGEVGIAVPEGREYYSEEELINDYSRWNNKPIVIKPNSTNFGTSVFLFPKGADEKDYRSAAVSAFQSAADYDNQVLVEKFKTGKEYRFLVIGDKVRAVLHRVPANVIGDGIHTISQLVEMKNKNPLRGTAYVKPLEKIRCGDTEKQYLAGQGLSFNSIPEDGLTVYLRENSNISTGGDSMDFTDDVHLSYKAISIAAAKAVGANICGVDLVANDIQAVADSQNYSIIELNFNPAIHIHDFPANGKNRQVETHILDLLGLGDIYAKN